MVYLPLILESCKIAAMNVQLYHRLLYRSFFHLFLELKSQASSSNLTYTFMYSEVGSLRDSFD